MKFVTIRKVGLFYQVFDDDALILHFLLTYKVIDSKVGFPNNALNKVINVLEEKKINYKVIGEDIESNFKDLNKYDLYLAKAKDKIVVQEIIHNMEIKLEKKSEEELLQILEGIEKLDNTELKNIAYNVYSCLKINNKRIHYFDFIKSRSNKYCNEALLRVFPKINIPKINDFMNSMERMSDVRKNFYMEVLSFRYHELEKVYNQLREAMT